ncbi:MAG: SPOR domain-containing protein [Notoacmeibacter sp.]|nr:SPOR domain-containing protein [Notoacmeibacter sp.]MCC0031818.1 SPOR domain-containing protein [Brucellaceae bacterium]
MADGNSFKLEDDLNLSDDDPMAELTRIMGFSQEPSVVRRRAPEPAADDYALDLEGEMIAGDSFEAPRIASSAFDISSLRAPQGVAASVVPSAPEVPAAPLGFDIPDLDGLSDGLDEVLAETVQADLAAEAPVFEAPSGGDLEEEFADAFDTAFAGDDAGLQDAGAADAVAITQAPLVAEAPQWDRAAEEPAAGEWIDEDAAGLDMDFGGEAEMVSEDSVHQAAPDAGYAAAPEPVSYATEADLALDDVLNGMDLQPMGAEVAYAEPVANVPVEEPAAENWQEQDAWSRDVAETPAAAEVPVHAMASADHAVQGFDDNGIEDELTALLEGREMPAVVQPVHQPVEAWSDPAHEEVGGEPVQPAADDGMAWDASFEDALLQGTVAETVAPEPASGPEIDDIQLDLGDFDEAAFLDQAFEADDLAPGDEIVESVAAAMPADPGQDELDAGISDLDPELLAGIEAAANADWDDAPLEDVAGDDSGVTQFAAEAPEPVRPDGPASVAMGAVAGIAAASVATVSAAGGVTTGFLSRFARKDGSLAAQPEMPEINTTDVPDAAVAPVDDLDIPAYEFEPETAPQSAADYDDLALDTFGAQTAVQAQADAALDARFDTYFNDSLAGQNASGAYAPAEPAAYDTDPGISRYDADPGVSRYDAHAGAVHSNAGAYAAPSSMEAGVVDAGLDRDLSEGFEPAVHGRQRPNRGMLIAAVVAGVALIGGIGAFALTSGSGERAEDGSAVVLADKTPVKVKPENPGGAEVPNQDKKVYEQVAGKTVSQTPEQKTLVSKSEEPVDVAKQNVRVVTPGLNDDATAKSEARIDPKTASEPEQSPEVAAVTPRRVKTFVVRPDGTLVASEAPEPAAPAAKPVEVAKAEPAPKAEEPAALKPVAKPVPAAEPKPAAAKPVQTTTIKRQVQPESVPVVPSRPAEQPVNIVGTTRQAAAPAPTPAAAPAQQVASSPAWVQISSHPSRELAQTSYRNALARYGSIISGKGVNIAAADIPGRGTFHRVNIPAASFNEAVAMCKRIKAAGGDCLPKR